MVNLKSEKLTIVLLEVLLWHLTAIEKQARLENQLIQAQTFQKETLRKIISLAIPELWQHVSGVIGPRGNSSVSDFTVHKDLILCQVKHP